MDDDELDALLGGPSLKSQPEEDDDFDDGQVDVEDNLPFASGGRRYKNSLALANVNSAKKGAPVEWFAKLLGIGRTTVIRKIGDTIDPIHVSKKGTKYYRPAEVLPYLVAPHDLKNHLLRMNPRDMPERLRKEFWGARKLEQDVRLRAKDLWHTTDVHRVLGDLMKLVKDTVRLWTDTIDDSVGLSTEQVRLLDDLSNKLLSDFADAVAQYAANGATPSQEGELEDDDE